MDNKFDILIYLLFVVVSIIGGIINNRNKKKAEEEQRQKRRTVLSTPDLPPSTMPPVSGPQTTVNPFEEFLRRQLEQFEEPEEPIDVIPVPEAPIDVIPVKEKPIDSAPAKSEFVKEGVAVFESTSKELFSDDFLTKDISLSDEIKDLKAFDYDEIKDGDLTQMQEEIAEFDATKAVVYAEILKRPVY